MAEKLKACRQCRALVEIDEEKCPVCGSTQFTKFWRGMVVIVDPEKSEVAKIMGIKYPGRYAIAIAR